MKDVEYLFIYGWLKEKYRTNLCDSHQIPIFQLQKVDEGYINGYLFRVADYPGMKVNSESKTQVRGEIYQLPYNFDFEEIDRFELALPTVFKNPEYRRIKSNVISRNGVYQCFLYEYLRKTDTLSKIESGIF